MQILNEPWPWWGMLRGPAMSVTELIGRGALTPEVAAVLWWAVDHGTSLFVAGGPPGAGPAVQRPFGLLNSGVRMFGTLHARSAAEALGVICSEAELTPDELPAPFVFVALAAYRDGPRIVRRVVEVGFLRPWGEFVLLAHETPHGVRLDAAGLDRLADWSGVPPAELSARLEQHAHSVV